MYLVSTLWTSGHSFHNKTHIFTQTQKNIWLTNILKDWVSCQTDEQKNIFSRFLQDADDEFHLMTSRESQVRVSLWELGSYIHPKLKSTTQNYSHALNLGESEDSESHWDNLVEHKGWLLVDSCSAILSIIYTLFLNCLSAVYLLPPPALLWGNGNKWRG